MGGDVWSAGVSPDDENEKIPSGETPALHTRALSPIMLKVPAQPVNLLIEHHKGEER